MIKSLSLKNFRTHQNSQLNFHPGVNVIVGLSRSGKTNILRGLRWLTFFRPVGDNVVSDFTDPKESTEVILATDSSVVRLDKGSKQTVYTYTNFNEDAKYLKGFGTTVPTEVTKALNITELNMQEQIDEHFLITKSPGEVARVINEIIRIEKVDSYISSLTTKINTTNHKITLLEGQNKETKESIDSLDYLDDLKVLVDEWTVLENRSKELEESISKIKSYSKELQLIEKDCLLLSEVIREVSPDIDNLEQTLDYLNGALLDKMLLLEQAVAFEEKYKKEDIELLSQLLTDQEKIITQYHSKVKEVNQLEYINQNLQDCEHLIGLKEEEKVRYIILAEKCVDRYIEALKKEKECPTCGGIIDDKCIQRERKKLLADIK